MKIIEKDILTVERGIIFQQVNCQKVMASGLAKQIREKWPTVYNEYIKFSNIWKNDFERLGQYQFLKVEEELFVVNVFSQLNYGYDKIRYTDYSALNDTFKRLQTREGKENIYFPFNFGCDRGGGDWNIVSKMIDYYFPNAVICKLP